MRELSSVEIHRLWLVLIIIRRQMEMLQTDRFYTEKH